MNLKKSLRNLGALKKTFTDNKRRVLDLVIAVSVLPSAVAISSVVATTVLLNGKKEIFKKSTKLGLDSKPFELLTFNYPNAPKHFIWLSELFRRSHAYQLPMIINLLKGDIALVGPMPITLHQAGKLEEHEYVRFTVRPGLTDIYKIRQRMNIAFEGRAVLEKAYIAERSVSKDLSILGRTIPALILGSANSVNVDSFVLQDIKLDNLSMRDAISKIIEFAKTRGKHVAFANPHCFNVSRKDKEYFRVLSNVDMLLPDGIGIKIAGFLIGAEVRENVNGTDLFPRLCKRLSEEHMSMFLLGGSPGVSEQVRKNMCKQFPDLNIVGTWHGFFEDDSIDEQEIISAINHAAPDVLLVARGVPKQDTWINKNLDKLHVGLSIGVGGLFDFYAGIIPRAPIWVRELGMEWFWRLQQEPSRMASRYLIGNPMFLFDVWKWYASLAKTQIIDRFSGLDSPNVRLKAEMRFQARRMLWWVASEGSLKLKRSLDIVAAASGLIITSPMFLAVAIANKMEAPSGSVFFSQERVGLHGKIFKMYKFRSMRTDAESMKADLLEYNESEGGVIFKIKDDPRVTKVGKFIRRFSIDEMPQIYNVLIGDMSLVGPRPPTTGEVQEYQVQDRDRLDVTPGLTCIWQVSGRSLLDFNKQVILDREYIHTQSIWGDILLILKTIPAVMTGYGAY